MKKKIMLAVATMVMAAVACVSLVACAPSHPVDYMEKFVTSKDFAYGAGQTIIAMDGNKAEMKTEALGIVTDVIMAFEKDTVEIYSCLGDKWSYNEVPAEGAKESLDGSRKEYLDKIKAELKDKDLFDKTEFDKVYEKKDGYYQTKAEKNITRMKVDGSKLVIEVKVGDTFKELSHLDLGYSISIPSEAKQAKSDWQKNNK